jgi:hypothetical protein
MLLQPKEYMLCDDKNYLKKYGIIAQDVKQTLPEFVYTDEDYIANIYTNAIYSDDNNIYKLQITKDISNLISIHDELKILLDNNDNSNIEIIIEDLPYHNRYKKRFVIVKSIIDNLKKAYSEAAEGSEEKADALKKLTAAENKLSDAVKKNEKETELLGLKVEEETLFLLKAFLLVLTKNLNEES